MLQEVVLRDAISLFSWTCYVKYSILVPFFSSLNYKSCFGVCTIKVLQYFD